MDRKLWQTAASMNDLIECNVFTLQHCSRLHWPYAPRLQTILPPLPPLYLSLSLYPSVTSPHFMSSLTFSSFCFSALFACFPSLIPLPLNFSHVFLHHKWKGSFSLSEPLTFDRLSSCGVTLRALQNLSRIELSLRNKNKNPFILIFSLQRNMVMRRSLLKFWHQEVLIHS